MATDEPQGVAQKQMASFEHMEVKGIPLSPSAAGQVMLNVLSAEARRVLQWIDSDDAYQFYENPDEFKKGAQWGARQMAKHLGLELEDEHE